MGELRGTVWVSVLLEDDVARVVDRVAGECGEPYWLLLGRLVRLGLGAATLEAIERGAASKPEGAR